MPIFVLLVSAGVLFDGVFPCEYILNEAPEKSYIDITETFRMYVESVFILVVFRIPHYFITWNLIVNFSKKL